MKKFKGVGILMLLGVLWLPVQGEDSYFPIGVWGVGHRGDSSLVHEESCFVNLGINFMAACTRGVGLYPGWYEDTLMTICDRNGMKLCAGSNPDWKYEDSRSVEKEELWRIFRLFHVEWTPNNHQEGYHHSWTKQVEDKTWQQRVDSCLTSMRNHYSSHPSFFGYLAMHENNINCDTCNPAAESICQWIKQNDSNHKSMATGNIPYMVDSTLPFPDYDQLHNPQFFDSVESLDVFESEVLGWEENSYTIQEWLDWKVRFHEICDSVLRGRHTKWHALFYFERRSGTTYKRRPTEAEMRVDSYLALSRGTKGLKYYCYGYFGSDGIGFVDQSRNPYAPPYHYEDSAYLHLQNVIRDLRVLEPVLARIDFDTAVSISPTKPFDSLRYIVDIDEGGTGNPKPFDSLFFEVATYIDTADTDYFLIVNRQCLPTDTVCVSIVIGNKYV